MLMLAHNYSEKRETTNWLWSEKLDGVRAELNEGKLISRNNKPINAPQWWLDRLPDLHLDGELFCGRGQFQKTVSYVRKKVPIDDEWKKVSYIAFDCMNHPDDPFSYRLAMIPYNGLRLTHQPIQNINEHFNAVLELGGEGIMLRNPDSKYERKRSWNLLKLKPELKLDVEVVGHTAGLGKHTGRTGALICKTESGKQFQAGTGLTDLQRNNPPPVGSIVKISCQELTLDGIPRFPVYL